MAQTLLYTTQYPLLNPLISIPGNEETKKTMVADHGTVRKGDENCDKWDHGGELA